MVDVGALVGLGFQLFEDIPYSNGGIMMAVNTDNKKKIKELILIIVASLAAVIIYHAAASEIERIVPDIFLSAFLAEAVFAVLTLVIVLAFKKTYIFKNDRTRLKSGWPSAGLLFVMMLFYLVMGLGDVIAPQQITGKSFGLGVLVLGGLYLLASIFVLRPKKLISLISE